MIAFIKSTFLRAQRPATVSGAVAGTVLAAAFALSACSSTKANFEHSPAATAAQAKLTIKGTDNDNTAVKFTVKHLPQANMVRPEATTYVVWARPEGSAGPTMNLGQLKLNDNLEGKLETLTPYRSFQLLVTPERDATTPAPTSDPVLWARAER